MVYAVTNTGAQATIAAVEKWTLHFGIPQSIIHDRGTAFLNTDFVNWTKELGITLRPRTAHSLWTNGKVKTQNQHIARYWRSFLNDAGTNWAPSHQNLPSRIIRVLITLLEKLRTKSSLVPSHRFLYLSNWDFIVTNINYFVGILYRLDSSYSR